LWRHVEGQTGGAFRAAAAFAMPFYRKFRHCCRRGDAPCCRVVTPEVGMADLVAGLAADRRAATAAIADG